jgi:enoyl-[acyl-carrier-protein] reductase (NADH)
LFSESRVICTFFQILVQSRFVQPSSLMKGFATVDEVAAMSTYLASELSSATDGAALRADGGVLSATL